MSGVEPGPKPALMPVEEALREILATVNVAEEIMQVPLTAALGKVLAEDVVSCVDVPPADNSAMDGYAVASADLDGDEDRVLPVGQRIAAGAVGEKMQPGTAVRIFTGAEIPVGADAVIMQEQTEIVDGKVSLLAEVTPGQNIRLRGQDICQGHVVVPRGQKLRPQELGLLASIGVAAVTVYKPLKVAVLSTGDELVEPGTDLGPGKIYNSNRFMLSGLVTALGLELVDLGIVPDSLQETVEVLEQAAQADVIISSGGVSVGEEDHVKEAVEVLGELNLWKLAIKPGKPFAYGHIKGTPLLALPGNPAAVFVTFCVLCRPWLLKKQGAVNTDVQIYPLPAGFSRTQKASRQEYLRSRVEQVDGTLKVIPYPNQSSGVLSSACWGNGFAVVPVDTLIEDGDRVSFIAFNDLLY